MSNPVIESELERLAELRAQRELLRLQVEEQRAAILAPVQADLSALEDEMKPLTQAVDQQIALLEQQIKQDVLIAGASVNGTTLQAQHVKGHTSWDGKRLDGLALAYPEINACKAVGDPSVRIVTRK